MFDLQFEDVQFRPGVVCRRLAFVDEALRDALGELELPQLLGRNGVGRGPLCRQFALLIQSLDHCRDLDEVGDKTTGDPPSRTGDDGARQGGGGKKQLHVRLPPWLRRSRAAT